MSPLPSHPDPTPLALAPSQPVGEPGKQSDRNSGSGSLSPARGATVSPAVGTQAGCGLWFPVGMGSLGATGMSPLGVCTAREVGVLSRCPHGCHLPCCLAAVSVLGLGLTVPPGAPSVDQDSGTDTSHKAWTVQHSPGAAQGRCKDPASCLVFPRKVKISS